MDKLDLEVRVPAVPMRLWSVVYSVVTACLMSLMVGTTLAFSSPALLELTQLTDPQFQFNTQLSDIFGASSLIGAIFGGPVGGIIADRFGRKPSLVLNSIPYLSGYFIILSSYLATNGVLFKVLLMVGRFFTGVGMGWAYVAVPVYIAEISPSRVRGVLATLSEVSLDLGIFLVFGLGAVPGFQYYDQAVVQVGIVTLFIFMVSLIPETPRYLLQHGDQRQTEAVLRCLRGPKYREIDEEVQAIKLSIVSNKNLNFCQSVRKIFLDRSILIPFLLVLFLYVHQQLCGGGSTVTGYAGPIFLIAAIPDPNLTATYSLGIAKIPATIAAVVLVELAGRKILLAVSSAGMAVSSLLLGVYFYITRTSLCSTILSDTNATDVTQYFTEEAPVSCNSHLYPLAIVGIVLFVMSFSIGLGPVPWVILSEYLPLQVRGVASGMVVAANWSAAAVVTGSFLSYSEAAGLWFAWWTFSVINIAGFFVIVLFVVETKGKKLEEVQELFKSSSTNMCQPLRRSCTVFCNTWFHDFILTCSRWNL